MTRDPSSVAAQDRSSAADLCLQARQLSKHFDTPAGSVPVLQQVDLEARSGDALAITGPSGSGKSTLLHLLGTLDQPSSGSLLFDDLDPFELPEQELARFRNAVVGFVFQDHHLLPQYSLLENVLLPTLAFPRDVEGDAEARARQLLERVGLSHRLDHRPSQLSGGERQRTAIARALIRSPRVLLCDEPTGNLDEDTADAVANLLFELHEQENTLLMVITHSPELAARFPRRLALVGGRLEETAVDGARGDSDG
ncbi:MAG: ABC transporter ATP-binding protein [Acidobacteriota bacterium]